MAVEVFKGSTSRTTYFELVDSTTGLPKTGIVYTDVTGSYVRSRAARTAITMATLGSASASWSSGGFILVDDTNQPGIYRTDVPDAAFATGVEEVVVTLKATGCRTVSKGFVLTDWNKQVASVPNVAAGSSGGLPTVDGSNAVKVQSGTGANQISLSSGLVTLAGVTHTGATIPTVTTTGTATNVTTVNGLAANVITATSIASDAITAAKIADGAIDAATFAAGAINAAAIATDAITAAKIATDAGTEIGTAVWATTTRALTDKAGFALTQSFPTNFSSLAITAGGIASADLQTIKTQTVTCAAGVTVLASVGTAATSTAQTGDSYARIGATGSGLTSLAPSSTALSTANWTTARAGYLDNINGHTAQTGDAYAIVNHTDHGNAKLVRSTTPANALTVEADGSIEATLATGQTVGIEDGSIVAASFGAGAIDAAAIASDALTAAKFASDVTTELQSGLATSSALATVAGNVTSALADTNELQTDWANGGRLDLILDARASQASVDAVPTAAENLAAWLADANVIALLSDALEARTNTDALVGATTPPTGPPAADATVMEFIAWLGTLARNKLVTDASGIALRNDGDSADIASAAHAETGGTYTRDEWTA